MDIAEKKREYDALKALSSWIGYAATPFLLIGMIWFNSLSILVLIGLLIGYAGTSLNLYARYRFGLTKSFYSWMVYQGIYTAFVIGIVFVLIAIDIFG